MIPNLALAFQLRLMAAGIPIIGVSIGILSDRTTWRIDFKPEATQVQRETAQAILAAFDPATAETRSSLAQALDAALGAMPSIDLRIKAVFEAWRKQIS